MKNLIITLMFLTVYLTSVKGQTEIPVKSTWIKEDAYGRMYDTKIPKERYRTNSSGEIEGLYILYNEDGKTIQKKITYKNGKKDGPANLGYASGNYKNDLEEGEWIEHYLGENITIINYVHGVIVGKKITYSDKSRTKILSFTEYQNGIPNGKHISYFEDGTVKEEGNYLAGNKTGYWVEYGPDLVTSEYIFSKGNYINGNRDGEWVNYGKCYAYLGAYGKEYSYVPKQADNSYIEFTGGSGSAFGPKKGYNAKYNNGTYLKDEVFISAEVKHKLDSIENAYNKANEERIKAFERKQDSIRMAKEKVENDYIQMINGVKAKPLTEIERNFIGNWEFKSDIYVIYFAYRIREEFSFKPDRSFSHEVTNYSIFYGYGAEKESKSDQYVESGVWELSGTKLTLYLMEKDKQKIMKTTYIQFSEINKKNAKRNLIVNNYFNSTYDKPLIMKGKKVSNFSSFDSNSAKTIMQ